MPQRITTDEDLAQRIEMHFAKLATIGNEPDGSITRLPWSDEESAAMAYIRAQGEAFGLRGSWDGVGNLILSSPGEHTKRYLIGSHLDSVPRGGNYDGAAGIVAGLEALRLLHESTADRRFAFDLVVWRGEEYTFNAVYKGSAAAFGLSDPHILHNLYGNQTIRDVILHQGFDPAYIDEGRPSLPPEYLAGIEGYFELHIEQGNVLQQHRTDLGIVTSIAGDRRILVVLEGRFDHSGATPMGMRFRSDVNLAMAYIQVRLDELARERRSEFGDFTQTVGIVNADPEIDKKYPRVNANSVTKVSGMGYFTLDIMSADDGFLDDYSAEVHRLIWRVSREHNVKAFIEQTDASFGLTELSPELRETLRQSCDVVGASYRELPSGAGHDAVMVAAATRADGSTVPVAMLFVPCRDGISHSRDEYAAPEHVAQGARVLAEALRRLNG